MAVAEFKFIIIVFDNRRSSADPTFTDTDRLKTQPQNRDLFLNVSNFINN